jgi:hypothetical protein
MGRIELRYSIPALMDGLSGSGAVNESTTPPVAGATSLTISPASLNTAVASQVPVGARFTVAGETAPQVHVVTARTPASGVTTSVTFAPALGAGTYTGTAALTFQPQQLEIKIGDGDLKYSEKNQFHYDLDRGLLDVVRDGDDVPMAVDLNFTWVYTKSGTGEAISPIEAIKGIGAASEWVSSCPDLCQPYSVDLQVVYTPPCATVQPETYVFPMFRSEDRDYDWKNANVAIKGKCNVTAPVITRGVA